MTAIEVVVGHLPEDLVAQNAGVGDEDVQSAEVVDRCFHEGFSRLGRADRRDDGDRSSALSDDLGNYLVGSLLVGDR